MRAARAHKPGPPDVIVGAHHFAGSVWVYVPSTSICSQNSATGPAKRAGENFFEPPGSKHVVGDIGLIMRDQWVKRHPAQAPNMDFDEFATGIAKGTPLGRIGTAEEFANLVCFLASEQGSYITGTTINVDGGRSPLV
jgi:Enoyl-(Acyl carrier protein) reductase